MKPIYYEVILIDGDYAHLKNIETQDVNIVAMALLPYDIMVGNKIKSEMMEYSIVL